MFSRRDAQGTVPSPYFDGGHLNATGSPSLAQTQAMNASMIGAATENRIAKLTLVCEAMWELMVDAGWTEEHLRAKLAQLDRSDGRADHKRERALSTCRCGAKVLAAQRICQFCGADAAVVDSKVFDTLT
ncbi:MAG: hypothetical protein R2706_03985 [Acidimicrobiales bacterium]